MPTNAALAILIALASLPSAVRAQGTPDSTGAITAVVRGRESLPVTGAVIRSGAARAQTDSMGMASLRLPAGAHLLLITRFGFSPESLSVQVRVGMDTTVTISLTELSSELAGVIVSSTRSERRIENEPLRVEVLTGEEVEEKLLMTPGDITMMLNETTGLRVQTTSPSLGGANVRVQGLRGRYTQILADGLPLYGAQTGGLGLLQIPPMDLGGVEIIKGVASALYGGSALGGVINLSSRRPGSAPVREILLNTTTLGGTDVVAFLAGAAPDTDRTSNVAYTLLAGAHRQRQVDRDNEGWTDLPGYERLTLRPRAFWRADAGHSVMLTSGFTAEDRDGGSMPGANAPDGEPYPERLRTRRYDGGVVGRFLTGGATVMSVRGSASAQAHRHTFGAIVEHDRHFTWFSEATLSTARGPHSLVLGAALQQERYDARDVPIFDFRFTTPAVFAQLTTEPADWLAITTSGRVDWHSEYGTFANPRVSLLLRSGRSWNVRASAGAGYFAPTPFTEETEVTGLTPLRPLSAIRAERARSASIDIGGVLVNVELNVTFFGSRIAHPIGVRPIGSVFQVELVNLNAPTRTRGAELLARWRREPMHLTASYTYVHSTEPDPESSLRRSAALTPKHQAGVVGAFEQEGRGRVGVEIYYTGRQPLHDDAFLTESSPYVHIGVLAERVLGRARVFVNAENLLNMRQTTHAPLVRPTRGLGGRWTNDVWGPLEGRVANVGMRLTL